jgi:tetratricopeptide (TPR) repeat protein
MINDLEAIASTSSFSNVVAGALLELGESHLHRGAVDDAEAAFLQAHAHGADATSGLAQVAIEQGRTADAADLLRAALDARSDDHLSRARLMPLLVDAAALAGDVDTAARTADDLAGVAVHCAGAYCGAAAQARATVAWVTGRYEEAGVALRDAMGFYREVPLPIEMATVRLGLAVVALRGASLAIARIERSTALAAFEAASAVPIGVGRRWLDELAELDLPA